MNWKENIKNSIANKLGLESNYSFNMLMYYYIQHILGKFDGLKNKLCNKQY